MYSPGAPVFCSPCTVHALQPHSSACRYIPQKKKKKKKLQYFLTRVFIGTETFNTFHPSCKALYKKQGSIDLAGSYYVTPNNLSENLKMQKSKLEDNYPIQMRIIRHCIHTLFTPTCAQIIIHVWKVSQQTRY